MAISVFTVAGGAPAFRSMIDAFYDRVERDDLLGGYEAMVTHHRGLGITGEQRFRFASLMSLAADDAGMPADPEFRAALVGYLEWGTRLAQSNSQPGAAVVERAPVPRWGWGVAPPYQPDAGTAANES